MRLACFPVDAAWEVLGAVQDKKKEQRALGAMCSAKSGTTVRRYESRATNMPTSSRSDRRSRTLLAFTFRRQDLRMTSASSAHTMIRTISSDAGIKNMTLTTSTSTGSPGLISRGSVSSIRTRMHDTRPSLAMMGATAGQGNHEVHKRAHKPDVQHILHSHNVAGTYLKCSRQWMCAGIEGTRMGCRYGSSSQGADSDGHGC